MALSRNNSNKMIAGVCSGIAQEYGWDPTIVRLLTVILALVTALFPFLVAYVILWIVMPEAG
ncbi:MAG: PspC domain-containing protein [Phycisphaerales bacterium]|nr:PspC domain-containing protein [Phycisphaerales bacterium]